MKSVNSLFSNSQIQLALWEDFLLGYKFFLESSSYKIFPFLTHSGKYQQKNAYEINLQKSIVYYDLIFVKYRQKNLHIFFQLLHIRKIKYLWIQ